MKLHIERTVRTLRTNIFGKPLETEIRYRVYRRVFFGLKRLYILIPILWYERKYEIPVTYVGYKDAYTFKSFDEAKLFVSSVKENPDRFIRVLP